VRSSRLSEGKSVSKLMVKPYNVDILSLVLFKLIPYKTSDQCFFRSGTGSQKVKYRYCHACHAIWKFIFSQEAFFCCLFDFLGSTFFKTVLFKNVRMKIEKESLKVENNYSQNATDAI